jgi:(2R)-sulfolactate sulfo-lyase subunit alpha
LPDRGIDSSSIRYRIERDRRESPTDKGENKEERRRMAMQTHFIVHDKTDTVGVVVVEDVKPGQDLTGWVMETDETIGLKSLDAVPLGHKIALGEIRTGDTVLKYGNDVGRAVTDIGKGRHVHVHNMKTKRW